MDEAQQLKDLLLEIGTTICRKVHKGLKEQTVEELSQVAAEDEADTIYQIDKDVEEVIVPRIAEKAQALGGIHLLAEGIGENAGGITLPEGRPFHQCRWQVIMDPIDGTRGIMYDKRSAFYLAAAAPNKGQATRLSDVEVAVMTELPTSRSDLSDNLWAAGNQWGVFTHNLATEHLSVRQYSPSAADTIIGGFAQIARFFPPGRDILAKIEDELIATIAPEINLGRALIFEDQYICTGGQLYQLIIGHDRFIADLRSGLYTYLTSQGKSSGHVCHPYDICTALIARKAGVILTDLEGQPFDAPLDLLSPVDWIGYANEKIRKEVEPVLHDLLEKYHIK